MPVFHYRATNPAGGLEQGLQPGSNLEAALSALNQRGLQVQEIKVSETAQDPLRDAERQREAPPTEARPAIMTQVVGPLVNPVGLTSLAFFFRQLSTMLGAGVGPHQALETLSRQTQNPVLRGIILELKDHVLAGRQMSVGMQRYPEVFTPLMLSMVRTGERTGLVDEQTGQLADYLDRDIELRNLIRRETAYPKIVIGASICIILAANLIISSVAPGAQGLSSPLTTLGTWYILGPLLILGFFGWRYLRRNPSFMSTLQSIGMSLPWFGPMIHGFAMARFGRAFGALYKAGVPLQDAVIHAADACGNEAVRHRIYPAASRLQEGWGITHAFEETRAFSPIVLDMTRTGEMTGEMDRILIKMSEFYEQEGQTRSKQAALMAGVLAFLMVAAYIGYLVVGFWSGYGARMMSAG